MENYNNNQSVKEVYNCWILNSFFPRKTFERLIETHRDYVGGIIDENAICRGRRYLEDKERKVLVFREQIFDWIAKTERKLLANLKSQISNLYFTR